jgi:predicted type IV restriction endonuclease
MAPPQVVIDLVERFERNAEAYNSVHYNEAQLRVEFVDPFFEALGWDIPNRHGTAEAYKDVVREISIKVGADTKAPDYCFRIGGTPKFFLEAKKPAINIKQDQASAFQLRRYAWSRKLPLSLLTSFREFAAYDCRVGPPSQSDEAATARTLYYTYRDYLEQWDEIAGRFSREAVLKRLLRQVRRKRKTQTWYSPVRCRISAGNRNLAQRPSVQHSATQSRPYVTGTQLRSTAND